MFFPDFQQINAPEILSILAVLGLILLAINYFLSVFPLARYKKAEGQTELPPVSVIICAKNEDENLTEFLPKVLSQDYPEFEVIVVNDCSWDNTENVIDEFAKIFPNLRKTNIKEDPYYKHGKKFAMLVGIKAAKYNNLVLTDADCYPAGEDWLKAMSAEFSVQKEIILGYGAYEKGKGLLNRLIRFDSFMIAVNYLSAALRNKAYMGVGRNLAYTKELFFKEKGFSRHYHITSGDDDLFVNYASNSSNTAVAISKEAITYSKPKKTFRDWVIQKSRHLRTAPLYTSQSKSLITFNYFSQYFFHLSLLPLFFFVETLLLIPILLSVKAGIQWLVLNGAAKRLNESDLLLGSVVYELILLVIYPIFQVGKFIYKPNKWTN